MNALINVTYFLVDTLFTLYIIVVLLRLLLGMFRADFHNPVSQFVVAATNPLIAPLRRILPSFGKIDSAAIVLAIALKMAQIALLWMIKGGAFTLAGLVIMALAGLIKMIIYIFMFALIILAVMSWINPAGQAGNPMYSLLRSLTDPLVRPVARVLPRVGMFDLSFLAVIILLQIPLVILASLGF